MKTIHFFGCSFTAGHELPDDDILPWKKDCKTMEEYYTKTLATDPAYCFPGTLEEYVELCKSMAYPSIIESKCPSWRCINHAELGSSIKQEIFKAVNLIENNEPLDFLVFQIPHFTREFILTNEEKLESFSINFPIINSPEFNAYLEKSVVFHSINHWGFHGQLDLLMFQGYLRSKNIKFIFLDLEGTNAHSTEQLGDVWRLKYPEHYNLQRYLLGTLLGGHFDLKSHNNFAEIIINIIKKTI